MSAFLFGGEVGSGKTYAATTMAHWLMRKGRKVAVNWKLTAPAGMEHLLVYFEEYGELFGLEDIDILADEAQSNAGARDWEALPKKTRNWLSHHRHYGNNLLFFSQHYKFVDVYIRRLAPKGYWSIFRVLNLTLAVPHPDADPETGEPGRPDILGMRMFIRPWHDLDHPWPIGGFFALLGLSRETPSLYLTRDKSTSQELAAKKISPAAAAGASRTAAAEDGTAKLPL